MTALGAIERGLKAIGYRPELLQRDYRYPDLLSRDCGERTVALAAFTQAPESCRSAALGVVLEADGNPRDAIASRRGLGAPVFLSVGAGRVAIWRVAAHGAPVCLGTAGLDDLEPWLGRHADRWSPRALQEAKSALVAAPPQPNFVDLGLLPAIEHAIQSKLGQMLREGLKILIGAGADPVAEDAARRAVFRLLAAKLLMDRAHPAVLDWATGDVTRVLRGVAGYYRLGDSPATWEPLGGRRLEAAWAHMRGSVSLRHIPADSVASVYQGALASTDGHQRLGTQGTPRHVADYALSRLDLDRFDSDKLRIFVPFAGATAFLLSALRHLQDRLPLDAAPERRHDWLTARLAGSEADALAREVAVQSLILADYPARGGWRVRSGDLFADGMLARELKDATVVLCHPPFEDFDEAERKRYPATVRASVSKAAFVLSATLEAAPEALAFVMPEALLRHSRFRDTRAALSERYRSLELRPLPRWSFADAGHEAALVIAAGSKARQSGDARRLLAGPFSLPTAHRASPEPSGAGRRRRVSPPEVAEPWLGSLDRLWEAVRDSPRLGDQADVYRGLQWWREQEGVSDFAREGFRAGLDRPGDSLRPFALLRSTRWLSLRPESLMFPSPPRRLWDEPKVLANSAAISRGHWRLSAAADWNGLAASQQFFVIWPREGVVALDALAAILNSPLVNAYVSERSSGEDLRDRMLLDLPMPVQLDQASVLRAVAEYRGALAGWESGARIDESELEQGLRRIDELVLAGYGLDDDLRTLLFGYFAGQERPVDHRFSGWAEAPGRARPPAAGEAAPAPERRQASAGATTVGELLSGEEAARLLGTAVAHVRRLGEAGALLALPTDSGPLYPSFQFRGGRVLAGLADTLAAIADPSPWGRLNWLLHPDGRLGGRRPIDCLAAGEIHRVLVAAGRAGEHSAA